MLKNFCSRGQRRRVPPCTVLQVGKPVDKILRTHTAPLSTTLLTSAAHGCVHCTAGMKEATNISQICGLPADASFPPLSDVRSPLCLGDSVVNATLGWAGQSHNIHSQRGQDTSVSLAMATCQQCFVMMGNPNAQEGIYYYWRYLDWVYDTPSPYHLS